MRHAPAAAVALLALGVMLLVVAAAASATIEKPVNTLLPSIAGRAQEGSLLRAKAGKWTGGSLSYEYQWQRCDPECENIAPATTSEYTSRFVDLGARLRVLVTAENTAGATTATSEQTAEIAAVAPKNTALPAISGAPEEGQLLSVSTGTWSGTPASSYQYQWERCAGTKCTVITGAVEATYRLVSADRSNTMRVIVTDVNPAASKSATSAQTAPVTAGPPVPIDFPALTGGLRSGRTLTATRGTWDGTSPIAYSYSWQRCNAEGSCTAISEAAASTYTLGAEDIGKRVRVSVTASNIRGTRTSHSVATPPVPGASENFIVGWGEDYRGQLGTIFRTLWEASPVANEGRTDIAAIAAGNSFTLELHNDGTVTAAGAAANGSTGYGGRKSTWEQGKTQVAVKGLGEVKAISAAQEFGMALLKNGTVKAWGSNAYGQLGNGKGGFEYETGENRLEPKEVLALKGKGVVGIASGAGANYAILSTGEVLAWGSNVGGQLGVVWPAECRKRVTCETTAKKPSEEPEKKEPEHKCWTEVGWELCGKLPAPVVDAEEHPIKGVIEVSAGIESAYALTEAGEVLSWGNDHKDQLGQELEPDAHTTFTPPGRVLSSPGHPLKGVIKVSAGNNFGIALLESGEVVGWGDDSEGALAEAGGLCGHENKNGGGTWPCDRYATPIGGLEGVKVVSVDAGGKFSTVLGEDGKVYTVGTNSLGELGRGPGCEKGGGVMGLYETCFSTHWQAVPGVEHAQAVSAGAKSVMALLSPESAAPLPVIGVEPEPKALRLEWALPDAESSEEVVVRKWDSPGENETTEEESEGGGEEVEEPVEEGTGEPPTNMTLPHIRVIEIVEGERKVVHTEAAVGQTLEATTGDWSGTAPINYEYKWLLCKSGRCSTIKGATGAKHEMTETDAGHTIKVQITARNGVKPAGAATSEPTEVIKAEGEGRKSVADRIKLFGQGGVLLGGPPAAALEPMQYEVKLNSESEVDKTGNKTRLMVLTPLP